MRVCWCVCLRVRDRLAKLCSFPSWDGAYAGDASAANANISPEPTTHLISQLTQQHQQHQQQAQQQHHHPPQQQQQQQQQQHHHQQQQQQQQQAAPARSTVSVAAVAAAAAHHVSPGHAHHSQQQQQQQQQHQPPLPQQQQQQQQQQHHHHHSNASYQQQQQQPQQPRHAAHHVPEQAGRGGASASQRPASNSDSPYSARQSGSSTLIYSSQPNAMGNSLPFTSTRAPFPIEFYTDTPTGSGLMVDQGLFQRFSLGHQGYSHFETTPVGLIQSLSQIRPPLCRHAPFGLTAHFLPQDSHTWSDLSEQIISRRIGVELFLHPSPIRFFTLPDFNRLHRASAALLIRGPLAPQESPRSFFSE